MPRSELLRFATCLAAAAALACASRAAAVPVTRNLTLLAQRNDFPPAAGATNYSSCWSYVHDDGREYAILGVNGTTATTGGTAIYNVTNPAAPSLVGFIPGPQSIWREMKSYRNWIYIVTEGAGPGFGLQIVRMTNPELPVLAATYTTNFRSSHTVSVDAARGLLVCNGTRNEAGLATGTRILALDEPGIGATPETPVEKSWWPGGTIPVSSTDYVHDSVPVGDRLYASSIYPGIQRVIDIADPAAPAETSSWSYPGGFTHNAWPDATGNWLYVTDEVKGQPLKVFDISNLAAPVLRNGITSNPQAIVHNAHVAGDELYLSNYTEGIRVLDLSDPAHPAEFASADSYAGPSGGFQGVWAVCPYFPSGTVIASDRNSGLYVYQVVRDYGIVRARVINGGSEPASHACGPIPGSCCCAPGPCACGASAAPGDPFPDVEVHLTVQGDSLSTPADGIVQFAPSPGLHTVRARRFGFYDAEATVSVTAGSRDTVTLPLVARPTVAFTGTVRDAATTNPLEGAEVNLAYTHVHQHTGAAGLYSLTVPDDLYRLEVRRAGYTPILLDRRIGPGYPGTDYALAPAPLWDPLEAASGWIVGAPGDDATGGLWARVSPLGTGPRPPATTPPSAASAAPAIVVRASVAPDPAGRAPFARLLAAEGGPRKGDDGRIQHPEEDAAAAPNMAPYFDHTPGAASICFVTGQGTDTTNVDQADVDAGTTSLTTPALNAAALADPVVGFWRWFASYQPTGAGSGHNGPDPDDGLAVLISNDDGATWTPVTTIRGLENHWKEEAIRVADHVTPTALVRLRFRAMDLGFATTVEAAVDDLTLYDAAAAPVGAGARPLRPRVAFRAPAPNPSAAGVGLVLDLAAAGEVLVEVLDVSGRRVAVLHRGAAPTGPLALRWDGRDAAGREAPAGLYFARARGLGAHALTRFVRAR